MRVLALVTDAFGGFGGIAAYNRNFLSALADGGARLVVLPRLGTPQVLPEGVVQAEPRFHPMLYSARALTTALRCRPFDMIWCGHLSMLPLARFLGRLIDRPIWLQVHGIEAWSRPPPAIKSAANNCRMVTAVSRCTRHRFLAWSDIVPERVRVLQNCVSNRFSPGPSRSDLRTRYEIGSGPVLLTISRLSSLEGYKGHDRVLRCLVGLRNSIHDLVYIIGGDGDDQPRLKALAQELGVIDNCRFIGRVPDEEMLDLYRLADLFVMPSTGEGFGIVYLEAMACGTPALGLNVDGSVDPLTACGLGFAVSADCLGKAIGDVLSDPPKRSSAVPEDLEPFSRIAFGSRVRALAEEVVG